MQLRKPWHGKHDELHGLFVGEDLEIARRGRRGMHEIRLIPAEGGVRVLSRLSDGCRAETFVPSLPKAVDN